MDFVEQLKSSINIVKVIGDYVRLRRVGATGRYIGLCPFHQEKTPSFNVNQSRQFYKCFGCGAGGDVLKFVMEIEGLTFPETLKMLAERNGIPMPKRSEYADAESKLRGALLEIHSIAAQSFQENLRSAQGADARAYLSRRGVTSEIAQVFELGFSDPSGQALIRRLGERQFTTEQLDASGLVNKRDNNSGYFDAFRGRLMFPIHNESGKVIAFGGRAMRDDDQPKYLNSRETPIYRKTSVLYNLHRARDGMRKSNRTVLVEGYMDVIGVYSAGVREAVASCGTALTSDQVRTIHRHSDTVTVNFDPDTAGANATERAIQLLLDEGLHVKILSLDGGLDPDEYVKQNGAEIYRAKLDSAAGYFHWLADRARAKFDMRGADGRMDAFKFLLPSVQKIHDKLERAAIANDLGSYLGVDAGLVLDEFKKAATDRRPAASKPQTKAPQLPAVERILLTAVLSSSTARDEVLSQLSPEIVDTLATREIFAVLMHMNQSGAAFTFSALDGRLSVSAQTLLHEVAAADEMEEDSSLEQARACLRRLEGEAKTRLVKDLQVRMQSAARDGRMEEALALTAELGRLKSELKKVRGAESPATGVVH